MLPRCSQLKVAGPLQTQDIWALRHIFILFLRKVYGTESLRRAGEDRGAQSSRDHWGKWEKVSSKPKKASKSVLFRFSMWTEPRSWPNSALRFSGPGLPRPSPPPLQIIQRQPQRDSPSWGGRQLRYKAPRSLHL